MQRTFYAFFALMALIGISSTAIETAKSTAHGGQRAQRSTYIHDCEWEFVRFHDDTEAFADIGGDPTDQRLGAEPIAVDIAAEAEPQPEPIDYASVDANADPITGEIYGCGLGQPEENALAADDTFGSIEGNDDSIEADADTIERQLAEDALRAEINELGWDYGINNDGIVSEPSVAAIENASGELLAQSATNKPLESTNGSANAPENEFSFDCPQFVLEYLREFNAARNELDRQPVERPLTDRVAEDYANAEYAQAVADGAVPASSCSESLSTESISPDSVARDHSEIGWPSCGGYSPDWDFESNGAAPSNNEPPVAMSIESIESISANDPIVDDRWIGPEIENSPCGEAELINKVDGRLPGVYGPTLDLECPALPYDFEAEQRSPSAMERLLLTIAHARLEVSPRPFVGENEDSNPTGLWTGEYSGCDMEGYAVVTENGWTKEELAIADRQFESEEIPALDWNDDALLGWLGESLQGFWNLGQDALATLRAWNENSSARNNWIETR